MLLDDDPSEDLFTSPAAAVACRNSGGDSKRSPHELWGTR